MPSYARAPRKPAERLSDNAAPVHPDWSRPSVAAPGGLPRPNPVRPSTLLLRMALEEGDLLAERLWLGDPLGTWRWEILRKRLLEVLE